MAGSTRENLLSTGETLLLRKGYGGTGLSEVLAAAGVPKGSFYHHFDSKQDFALSVIDRWFAQEAETLARHADDERHTPLDRLRRYFAHYRRLYRRAGWEHGCLLGTIGQELPAGEAVVRARIDAHLRAWREGLASLIESAQDSGEVDRSRDPVAVAGALLDAWEGALLRATVERSDAPLRLFAEVTFESLLAAAEGR